MLYETTITIPASTTQASPVVERLPIPAGVITKIMVRPRPGHAGLAHCVIRLAEHQIAPSTEGQTFHGDAFPIDWEEHLEVSQPPWELKIEGWAPTATYEHSFDIFVAMLPRSDTLAGVLSGMVRDFLAILSPRRIFGGGG